MIVTNDKATLTVAEFEDLEAYAEPPTDAAVGKRWAQHRNGRLRLGEYVLAPEPWFVGIQWRDIEVIP